MSKQNKKKRIDWSGDQVSAAVSIIFLCCYGYMALGMQVALEVDVVGPGMFPKILTVLGLVMSFALLFKSIRFSKKDDEDKTSIALKQRSHMAVPIGILLIYALSLEYLGFLLMNFLFLLLILRYLGSSGWLRTAIVSIVVTAITYGVFHSLLGVRLPVGTALIWAWKTLAAL